MEEFKISWDICSKGTAGTIGNNSSLNIWNSRWIPNYHSLCNLLVEPLNYSDLILTPKDFYQDNTWVLNKISFDIPPIVTNKIKSIVIPSSNILDRIYWGETTNGSFTTKSCYKLINKSYSDQRHISNFDWIWTLNCPNKIKFFL